MAHASEYRPHCTCRACGSSAVTCTDEYFTTGGDLEHVEFTHTCRDCGHIARSIEQHCYGYDNHYQCPMCRRDLDTPFVAPPSQCVGALMSVSR